MDIYSKRLLSVKQASAALGVSESTLWRLAATVDSNIPKPIKLTGSLTRWDSSEIDAWIESRKAARSDGNVPMAAAAPIQRGRNPVSRSIRPGAGRPGRPRKVLQEAQVPA